MRAATENLRAMQAHLEAKALEKELLLSTNKELSDSINALDEIQKPDGTHMSKGQFEDFKRNVEQQQQLYNAAKDEVSSIQSDIKRLKQAEADLKQQYDDLQVRIEIEEQKEGISGYSEINDRLEQTSKEMASLNEIKSATLDDISATVEKITNTLHGKKQELEPKVRSKILTQWN